MKARYLILSSFNHWIFLLRPIAFLGRGVVFESAVFESAVCLDWI